MKNYILKYLFFVSLLLLSFSAVSSDNSPYAQTVIKTTQKYYTSQGAKPKNSKFLYTVWNASWFTSIIFGEVDNRRDVQDIVVGNFCFAAQETGFEKNHVEFNIPGVYLKPLHKTIQKFSVDFGVVGINNANIAYTYKLAKILQIDGAPVRIKKLREFAKQNKCPGNFYKDLERCHIPSDIKLKKISTGFVAAKKIEYLKLKNAGVEPLKIRSTLKCSAYQELTQDDITSLMIYRVLVEMERKSRGWSYNNYDKKLFKMIIKECNKLHD